MALKTFLRKQWPKQNRTPVIELNEERDTEMSLSSFKAVYL